MVLPPIVFLVQYLANYNICNKKSIVEKHGLNDAEIDTVFSHKEAIILHVRIHL